MVDVGAADHHHLFAVYRLDSFRLPREEKKEQIEKEPLTFLITTFFKNASVYAEPRRR